MKNTKKAGKTMGKPRNKEIDNFFKAVLSLESIEECYSFFGDICTEKELIDISQRLEVARLLRQKLNYIEISKQTGASTTTVSRVNKSLTYGNDGYALVFERLKNES